MRILLVEDDDGKRARIIQVLDDLKARGGIQFNLSFADCIVDARSFLADNVFDLMVLDIKLPIRKKEDPDATAGLLLLDQLFVDDEYNRPRYVVGITGIEDGFNEISSKLHRHGWVLLRYSASDSAWANSLSYFVKHINALSSEPSSVEKADVVILTALQYPEFSAVLKTFPELCGPRSLDEKTLFWEGDVNFEGKTLRVVAGHSWQMGLTAAAVLADKFLTAFRPKLIAMTGICAGFEDNIGLGDLIVASQSWEWQGGKLKDSPEGPALATSPEPYRASRSLLTDFEKITVSDQFASALTRSFYPQDTGATWKVHYGPMVSGLSVVASQSVMREVKLQHRKMLGLDMEAYAIYAAVEFHSHECQKVVMKGVCDFGDAAKGDSFQEKAAHRSAIALRALLSSNPTRYKLEK